MLYLSLPICIVVQNIYSLPHPNSVSILLQVFSVIGNTGFRTHALNIIPIMMFSLCVPILLAFASLGSSLVYQPDFAADITRIQSLQASTLSTRDDVPSEYKASPYYPTPPGGWVVSWADAYSKAQAVVSNMTLAEKVNLTTGG